MSICLPPPPLVKLFVGTQQGGAGMAARCRGQPTGADSPGWPHGCFIGGTSGMGLAPGVGGCRRNGRTVPVRAIWALICAYGGVLRARVGVLWELRYQGLWMTSVDDKCLPESLIPDI